MLRWLNRFGAGLLLETNRVNGVAALGGTILAVGGLFIGGLVGIILIVIALLILVPVFLIAVVRAFPPRAMSPQQAVGNSF